MKFTRRHAMGMVAAATAFATALAGCSSSSKPDTAVKHFFELVAGNKVDDALTMFSTADVKATDMTMARGKFTTIIGEMQSTMNANGGLDSVTIDAVDQKSETSARVTSTLKFKNGKSKQDRMSLVLEDGKWRIKVQ